MSQAYTRLPEDGPGDVELVEAGQNLPAEVVDTADEAPVVAIPVDGEETWSCPRCTLVSAKSEAKCEACRCPQPGMVPPPLPDRPSAVPAPQGYSLDGTPVPVEPRANPYVGGYFNAPPAYPQEQQNPQNGGFGGFSSLFGAGAQYEGEEEAKKESCARIGCFCACCCPCVGWGTFLMNRDARPGSVRAMLARYACLIATLVAAMNLWAYAMQSQSNR